ncbi:class I SAM-dependent methyltransferase [Methylosinus sp. Sm6]|uniref:class I SAM-dependent methyltransferase n=1 Tax=Methylosinus sp. Sm6 TaxID=2866948 RepID=UPI001C992D38|nr:class I SAM-dependent methyltransferase [Methylosinus sp. Sm6]MBY6243409.1 class I SAM-dependent methyltransferase [Methylosinus sp. Sm6]
MRFLLRSDAEIDWSGAIPVDAKMQSSEGIEAHRRYFGNPNWTKSYFDYVHREASFRERWTALLGDVTDKIVIEIGCGPGNVFSTLGLRPKVLVGVDVAAGALEQARTTGYEVLLADAHDLPFASGVADIVILNATIHHCEHMARVIEEAGRLVAPGGLLAADQDPQKSAWDFKGLGLWLWNARLWIYHWMKRGFHSTSEEQAAVLASELHHNPGDGVTHELFADALRPLGFDVEIFPHNHRNGVAALSGRQGPSALKFQVAQILSGMNPHAPESALSLLCLARLSRAAERRLARGTSRNDAS